MQKYLRECFKIGAAALLAVCLAVPVASAAQRGGGLAGGVQGGHIGGGGVRSFSAPPRSFSAPSPSRSFSAPRSMGGSRTINSFNQPSRANINNPVRGFGKPWKGPGKHPGVGPGKWPNKHVHHGRHHRRHARFYSVPYVYDDGYYRGNGCGWLWQRYLNTGNPKWKYRYYECID